MCSMRCRNILPVLIFALILSATVCAAVEYPGPAPGAAKAAIEADVLRLENNVLAVEWTLADGLMHPGGVEDKQAKVKTPGGGELFQLVTADGKTIPASALTLTGAPRVEDLAADPGVIRVGDHFRGKRIVAVLADKDGALRVRWQAVLRDGANYVRQQIVVEPQKEKKGDKSNLGAAPGGPSRIIRPVPFILKEIISLDIPAPGAVRIGRVLGSPVVAGNLFFACESPVADNQGIKGRVRCRLTVCRSVQQPSPPAPLPKGEGSMTTSCWSVVGVAPPGQMRRAFLCYVERERARPYKPFLHYNSFYDISSGGRKFDENESLAAIREFGRALVQDRGVKLDAFVFDDGWDDNRTLWQFHPGFPHGFTPLRDAAAKYHAALGAWLSPWGGYGEPKNQRLRYGRRQGFEVNANGFFLGGPKYYARFRQVCLDMMAKYGVRYFKFDGMGVGVVLPNEEYRTPTPAQLEDIEAMLRLTADLRRAQPDVYLSITTGTWPSPYWLWHGDSIWRNGRDMDFIGEGTMRQRWLNYRDAVVRQMVARAGPLYPLNSLMTQGITYARRGNATRMTNELKDLKDEFRIFFASGTQLQELYVTPQMMTPEMWDALAEAAKWSRANADVLVDTHIIGGSVVKGRVYGYASWSPRKGIVALRNPSGRAASFVLDLQDAWELPPAAPREYLLKSPWKEDSVWGPKRVSADRGLRIELQPFEVLVLESVAK